MTATVTEFEQRRPRLRAVAYRLLGSWSDADDALQEAWLRFDRADTGAVDNLDAWLTTVVSRISLNMLRARETRRAVDVDDVRVPDPEIGPAETAEVADSVGLALLVVLETLSPAERLAFVLHDVFAVPFDEIAPMIEKSPAATRQLASRARRRVQGAAPAPDAGLPAQREVVDAFFAAGYGGDFERLVALLHPDVVQRVDGGPGHRFVRTGPEAIANGARAAADPRRPLVPVTINGGPGALVLYNGRPMALLAFTVVGGRIAAIDAIIDQARLATLDFSAVL